MQDQFCDKLTVLIEQAPDPQTSTELSKILSRCKGGKDDDPAPEASTADSGGHAPTPPIKPPEKPTK